MYSTSPQNAVGNLHSRPTASLDRNEPQFLAPNDPDIPLLKYPVYNAHAFFNEGKRELLNPWVITDASTLSSERSQGSAAGTLPFTSSNSSERSNYSAHSPKSNRNRFTDDSPQGSSVYRSPRSHNSMLTTSPTSVTGTHFSNPVFLDDSDSDDSLRLHSPRKRGRAYSASRKKNMSYGSSKRQLQSHNLEFKEFSSEAKKQKSDQSTIIKNSDHRDLLRSSYHNQSTFSHGDSVGPLIEEPNGSRRSIYADSVEKATRDNRGDDDNSLATSRNSLSKCDILEKPWLVQGRHDLTRPTLSTPIQNSSVSNALKSGNLCFGPQLKAEEGRQLGKRSGQKRRPADQSKDDTSERRVESDGLPKALGTVTGQTRHKQSNVLDGTSISVGAGSSSSGTMVNRDERHQPNFADNPFKALSMLEAARHFPTKHLSKLHTESTEHNMKPTLKNLGNKSHPYILHPESRRANLCMNIKLPNGKPPIVVEELIPDKWEPCIKDGRLAFRDLSRGKGRRGEIYPLYQ